MNGIKLKVGDLVRRRVNIPYDRWAVWEDRCHNRGVSPTQAFTISTSSPSAGLQFHEMSGVWWRAEYFEPVYDLSNKALEDYL
jgi:hypothetical protein